MSDWTYKGIEAPIMPDDGSWHVDLGSWSKGVDAALGVSLEKDKLREKQQLELEKGYALMANPHVLYDLILDKTGYVDGAETSADGSADNDLAHERAQAVLKFIELVKDASVPESLLPKVEEEYKLRDGYDHQIDEPFFEITPGKFLYADGTRKSAMLQNEAGYIGWGIHPEDVPRRYTFNH